jgi:hypothetical protein
MPTAAPIPRSSNSGSNTARKKPAAERPRAQARIARDFLVLLGTAAAIGITAAIGMVLTVLALA